MFSQNTIFKLGVYKTIFHWQRFQQKLQLFQSNYCMYYYTCMYILVVIYQYIHIIHTCIIFCWNIIHVCIYLDYSCYYLIRSVVLNLLKLQMKWTLIKRLVYRPVRAVMTHHPLVPPIQKCPTVIALTVRRVENKREKRGMH